MSHRAVAPDASPRHRAFEPPAIVRGHAKLALPTQVDERQLHCRAYQRWSKRYTASFVLATGVVSLRGPSANPPAAGSWIRLRYRLPFRRYARVIHHAGIGLSQGPEPDMLSHSQ